MALSDEDPRMVDGLCHPRLEDESLQTALQEVLHGESEDVIKLVLSFLEEAIAVHPAKQGLSFENPARVLFVQREKFPCSIANPAQRVLHPPQLPLAAKPILADQLQFGIKPLLLVGTAGLLECLPVCKDSRAARFSGCKPEIKDRIQHRHSSKKLDLYNQKLQIQDNKP